MGRRRSSRKVQCPECGVLMFANSIYKHRKEVCKGAYKKTEEEEFTAEYIAAECAEIQKTWDPKEKIKRMTAKRAVPWQVPQPRGMRRIKDVSE